MKLLFVISKYYPKVGGTPNCTRNLIHWIRGEHTVQVLTTMDGINDPKTVESQGVTVHKEKSFSHIAMRDILQNGTLPFFTRLRAVIEKTFFRLIPIEPLVLRLKFRRRIGKLQKEEKFDWVIAVGGDIVPARAVLGCKGLNHTCFYQLDPYTTNATLPKRGEKKRCRLEKKIHTCVDLVVTTAMIREEMASRFTLGDHVVTCEFPNIVDRTRPTASVSEPIRCLFCGAVYAARNMERVLELIHAVTAMDSRVVFDFYAFGDTVALQKASEQNANIRLFEPVSPDEIFSVMNEHQVLVNVGNVMTNQVPSKLYDYISTGLPIVNVCCHADCPTISVLENYRLSLSVLPTDPNERAAEKVLAFIREKAGTREDYPSIQAAYDENTVACVAEKMISSMQRMGETIC